MATLYSSSSPLLIENFGNPAAEMDGVNLRASAFVVGAYPSADRGSKGISEDLCSRLAAAGWQMRIVSRQSNRFGRVLEMLWSCWAERTRYEVAAVDVYSGRAFLWAEAVCWLLRRVGKPYVLMLHGGNLPRFTRGRPGSVRKLLTSASAVTTPSAYLMEQMRAYREDIQLLPNGIDVSSYHYKVRRQVLSMVWLRAFHEVYNPTMAVRVLALLRREYPKIHLTMIGPDKGDGSLNRTKFKAEQLGVADHLTIAGPVQKQDVPDRLAAADIFLNTARMDNTPVSILEAMASGLCVVSTCVGGIPYLLRSEHDALLTPTNDPAGMAAAVRRIITEPDLATQLSRNGRRKAEQLDWTVVLPRWEKLLSCAIRSDS